MKIETKQKRIIVVFFLFLCYFVLLAPYIVHTNLNEVDVGMINDLKTVSVQSLPEDIQDVIFSEECTVLLVEDSISGRKTVIVTEKSPHSRHIYKGDVIEITDKIIEWYVDWHAYKQYFFDDSFSVLIVGDVEQISASESFIEEILSSSSGSPIFSLSKAIFALAPLLLILYISFSFKKRFYLWNIIAILALYSLEVFISNMVGSMHHITISDMWKYFGYLFLVLIPFTFFFSKYEESEEGQRGIKKFYDKIAELIARLFR
jgi:ASC-1-like (ASCH) protein